MGRTKTEEMHSPGSRVVSTIIAFSSKLEISEVIITCSCPLKRFPGGGCLWEGWVLNSIYRPDTIWRISVCVVICCQAGINCLSLLLLKELVCATRYPINVGTKPTKSVTCNEFSFEAKSSFIFFAGLLLFLPRFLLPFGLVLAFGWKKACSVSSAKKA